MICLRKFQSLLFSVQYALSNFPGAMRHQRGGEFYSYSIIFLRCYMPKSITDDTFEPQKQPRIKVCEVCASFHLQTLIYSSAISPEHIFMGSRPFISE